MIDRQNYDRSGVAYHVAARYGGRFKVGAQRLAGDGKTIEVQ